MGFLLYKELITVLISKKVPTDEDQKLSFPKMGAKPGKKVVKVENEKAEKKAGKHSKKEEFKEKKAKTAKLAKKAAMALAKK